LKPSDQTLFRNDKKGLLPSEFQDIHKRPNSRAASTSIKTDGISVTESNIDISLIKNKKKLNILM
jgi:hypothetical protein